MVYSCQAPKPPDYADSRTFQQLILNETEVETTRDAFTRKDRQTLEEKWSFSGICKSFSKSEDSGLRLFAHLAHGYGMSSHLLHKDADGIGMVWERRRRNFELQTAVRLAHSARLVSDVCAFAQLRLITLLRACKQPVGALADLERRYNHLFAEIEAANQHFRTVEYSSTGSPYNALYADTLLDSEWIVGVQEVGPAKRVTGTKTVKTLGRVVGNPPMKMSPAWQRHNKSNRRSPSTEVNFRIARYPAEISKHWPTYHIRVDLSRRLSELAVFDARLYIRVRRVDEPA